MKLSAALDAYWLNKQLALSPNTIAKYRYFFKRFLAFAGDGELEAVTTADIQRFLIHLGTDAGPSGRPLSRRSVHDGWAVLSSLWSWAERELSLPHVIRGKLAKPAYTRTVIEPFDERDLRALLRATRRQQRYTHHTGRRVAAQRATAARDRALLLTLLDSGLRVSELCVLCVGDYHPARGRLHVRQGKGNKARLVVLGDTAQRALALYLAGRQDR